MFDPGLAPHASYYDGIIFQCAFRTTSDKTGAPMYETLAAGKRSRRPTPHAKQGVGMMVSLINFDCRASLPYQS